MKDCCMTADGAWFRYRVGAVIVADGCALFARTERGGYYYSVGGGVHIGERSDEAVVREVLEETGERFEVVRPLFLVENFFHGEDGSVDGLACHTLELYYLMTSAVKREYSAQSVTSDGERERLYWLPLDRLDEYDIRPSLLKRVICGGIPESFERYVNDGR